MIATHAPVLNPHAHPSPPAHHPCCPSLFGHSQTVPGCLLGRAGVTFAPEHYRLAAAFWRNCMAPHAPLPQWLPGAGALNSTITWHALCLPLAGNARGIAPFCQLSPAIASEDAPRGLSSPPRHAGCWQSNPPGLPRRPKQRAPQLPSGYLPIDARRTPGKPTPLPSPHVWKHLIRIWSLARGLLEAVVPASAASGSRSAWPIHWAPCRAKWAVVAVCAVCALTRTAGAAKPRGPPLPRTGSACGLCIRACPFCP